MQLIVIFRVMVLSLVSFFCFVKYDYAKVEINLIQLFANFNPEQIETPITNYGGVFYSPSAPVVVSPSSIEQIVEIVNIANQNNIKIRIRGNGHTLNHSSIPQNHELLLSMKNVNHYLLNDNSVTVGAGVTLNNLVNHLGKRGLSIPIFNGGGDGPTVGGFISAGGISVACEEYGGFWENVESIKIVDGVGKTYELTPNDDDFKWIFGSLGKFCIIYEAKLKLLIPEGRLINLEQGTLSDNGKNLNYHYNSENSWYWFGLFMKKNQESVMRQKLSNYLHNNASNFHLDARYFIRFKNFNPPLVYPNQEDFIGLEIRAQVDMTQGDAKKQIDNIRETINLLANQNNLYHYYQVEYLNKSSQDKYFNKDILNQFVLVHHKFDPNDTLNPVP